MKPKISDSEILVLKKVAKKLQKPLRQKWTNSLKVKQLSIDLCSIDGLYVFELYMKQALLDENNFSCGISYKDITNNVYTLARYNGSSHVHVNKCDGQRFEFECHIHQAKEGSLKLSKKIENFAIKTERYKDLHGAINCILLDFNVIDLNISQLIEQGGLFDEH